MGRHGRDVQQWNEPATMSVGAETGAEPTGASESAATEARNPGVTPTSQPATLAVPAATTGAHATEAQPARSTRLRRTIDAIGMAEGGLLTDVAIILDLAAIYVPLFGAVFDPAVPAPFAILYLRRGSRVTWLAIIVATFLMTVLTGPHFGWRLGLRGVIGLFLGWAMKQRWRTTPTLALATLITTTTAFIAAFLVVALTGLPVQDLATELRNALESAAWLAATTLQIIGYHREWLLLRPTLVIVGNFSLRYWPFMFYVYTACVALPSAILYYAVANAAARVLGHEVIPFPPKWVMWVFRAFYLVVIIPIGFVAGIVWWIVTLPIRGPVWLWRLARPRRSPFAPRTPRPTPDTAASATPAPVTTTKSGSISQPSASTTSARPRELVADAMPLAAQPGAAAEGERR